MTDKPSAHYTINDKGPRDHAKGTFSAPNYTVVAKDWLGPIAGRFGVSLEALKKANGLTSDTIHPGDKLVIPGSGVPVNVRDKGATKHASGTFKEGYYTVGAGGPDTLYSIGARFGVTVPALKNANDLTSDTIHPGDKLVIPG